MTKISRQLNVSMGEMFQLINVFSIVLFMLLIYLLTKLIIEKNTTSISMVKILGYENRGNFQSVFDGDNLGCDHLDRCQPDHCLRADPPDLYHYAFRVQRLADILYLIRQFTEKCI